MGFASLLRRFILNCLISKHSTFDYRYFRFDVYRRCRCLSRRRCTDIAASVYFRIFHSFIKHAIRSNDRVNPGVVSSHPGLQIVVSSLLFSTIRPSRAAVGVWHTALYGFRVQASPATIKWPCKGLAVFDVVELYLEFVYAIAWRQLRIAAIELLSSNQIPLYFSLYCSIMMI